MVCDVCHGASRFPLFDKVAVWLIKEHHTVVPFMDDRSMECPVGDEKAIPSRVGCCPSVYGEIDGAFDDKLPLACMGMLWDNRVPVEFHEHDLFLLALDEVSVDALIREVDGRTFSDELRECVHNTHASWNSVVFNRAVPFKVSACFPEKK